MTGWGLTRLWGGSRLRRSWHELIGIVLLLGLLGAVSLCALAGARRTQSAYPRFLRASHASTMAVDPGPYDPDVDATIAGWPEVVRSTTYVAFPTGPMADGKPDFSQDFETLGTPNGRFFTMDRFTPIDGRRPSPDRVDEIAVNESAADRFGYRVGQKLDLGTYSNEQTSSDTFFDDPPPPKIRTSATIVGIGLFTDEVLEDDTNRTPLALVTPAFSKKAAPYAQYAWQGLALKRGDADVAAIQRRYIAAAGPGTPQFFRVTSVDTFHAQQAIRPLSLALGSFGAITALAALVLVGQAVDRQVRQAQPDQVVLRAFGAGPRALMTGSMLGPVLALAAGTLLAVTLAIAASPLMPLGAVRRVEVHRGVDADALVLGLGAGVFFFVLVAVLAAGAWRALPHRRSPRAGRHRRSRLAGLASSSGMSPTAVTGLRLAFEPGAGKTNAPVRSVMLAGGVAVVTLVAALTFGASFRHLLDSPALYGWSWDNAILDQSGYGNINTVSAHRLLDRRPEISGWSGAYFGANSIDGLNVPLLGMSAHSEVTPPVIEGRMIETGGEIVLGSETAKQLDKGIGDDVTVGLGSGEATLHVVGLGIFPTIGISHGAHTSLGVGALVRPERVPGYNRQAAGNGPTGAPDGPAGPPVLFVRFTSGADQHAARTLMASAAKRVGQYPGSSYVVDPQRPAEIVSSADVGRAPALLSLTLGVAAAISLAFALSASVRRRRRDFALLRALGFTQRQLAAGVAWQATATIGVGLVIGVPLGIVVGRTLWAAFANQLDVVSRPQVPTGTILVVCAIALIVANLAAALPARTARRVRPAAILAND